MNLYEEILHRLSSKSRIRALLKEVSFKDIERVISRVKYVLEEKLEQRERETSKRKEVQHEIEAFKKIMETKGLSLSDIGFNSDGERKIRSSGRKELKKYVFQYQDNNGNSSTWSGATTGRVPREFQNYMKKTGKKRLDCVVEEI